MAINIPPLLGAFLWRWSLFDVVFVYWIESAFLIFFQFIGLMIVDKTTTKAGSFFVTLIYTCFMAAYFLEIAQFYGGPSGATIRFEMFAPAWDAIRRANPQVGTAVLVTGLGQGLLFLQNFIMNGTYLRTGPGDLIFYPLRRIIIIQGIGYLTVNFYPSGHIGVVGLWGIVLLKAAADICFRRWGDYSVQEPESAGEDRSWFHSEIFARIAKVISRVLRIFLTGLILIWMAVTLLDIFGRGEPQKNAPKKVAPAGSKLLRLPFDQ